jgi:hypothetical protein
MPKIDSIVRKYMMWTDLQKIGSIRAQGKTIPSLMFSSKVCTYYLVLSIKGRAQPLTNRGQAPN